ncbi:MAG: DNA internalization-related competence protein ComEC/Rec2 [Eggerthellaceae bacterium]|nr:DNA internalization-related competence protein ComEC/Rec2 [Eggerthellaceae bacterium]
MSGPADPPRPTLPPLLVLGLGTWGGTAASYALGADLGRSALLVVLACSALAALSLAALSARRERGAWAVLALGVALGALCGASCALAVQGRQPAEPVSGRWELTCVEDARAGSRGARVLARVAGPQGTGALVELTLPGGDGGDPVLAGDALVVDAALRPVGDDPARAAWRRGTSARATAPSFERAEPQGPLALPRRLRRRAVGALTARGDEGGALMAALACGYRGALSSSDSYEAFKTCGLAHLVAVSGAHLSLVVTCLGALLRALRLPRAAAAGASTLAVGAYLLFAGAPISGLRAALMALSGAGALLTRRRSSSLGALGLCLAAFPAASPPTALAPSFVLSAGSTLGIVLFARLMQSWAAPLPRALRGAVAAPLSLTASSSLVTQPYAAALFSQLPVVAPLANVVAAPLFTLACLGSLLAAGAAALAPGVPDAVLATGALSTLPLSAATRALAALPRACLSVDLPALPMVALSALAAALLWRAWPRPRPAVLAGGCALTGAALAVLLIAGPLLAPFQIVMLDVGQGDALLVRGAGRAVLVDTGNRPDDLLRGLARHGVYRLDAVIVSHHDDDHMGALEALAPAVPVGRVVAADDALDCPCDSCARLRGAARAAAGPEGLTGLAAGDELALGPFRLRAVWPHRFQDEGGNADSLCLRVTVGAGGGGEWSALLTGDVESDQLRAMAAEGALAPVDVLKVGHHGSAASVDEGLARTLSPSVALVSVGERNRYGHPRPEPLAALEAAGAAVFRSDESGDVTVTFSPERIRVGERRRAAPDCPLE